MTRIILIVVCIMHCISLSLTSQTLEKTETIRIEFGKAHQQIGIDKGGGEHWKPLFFDIDDQGNIHIPDFYKARIAIVNRNGELIKETLCPIGISPRMNYFSRTSQGKYVTYSDYYLYLIDETGVLLWKKMHGYGVIPRFILANKVGIFLVLPGIDERSLVFDYFSDRPVGKFGFMDGDKGIPMVVSENKGQFTFSLQDMTRIPESTYSKESFNIEDNAFLVYVDKKNNSLWKTRKENEEYYYLFSDKGSLITKGTINFPDTYVEGSGFWTVADERFIIYKNHFYENHMEIVVYEFR